MELFIGTLLGILVTLFGIYIAQSVGLLQVSMMEKQYKFDTLKATPRIGSHVALELRTPNPLRPDVRRYFLVTTIYNESELAAQKLDGNWILTCSESVHNCAIPIQRDFLRSTPYNLEPHQLGGDATTQKIISKQVAIQVDIELTYFIPGEDAPQQYRKRYKNDGQNKIVTA